MDNIEGRIKEVMSSVFDVEVDTLNNESSQDTIEQWDSVKHLDLVVALEDEFEITIPIEEVGNMVSFKYIKLIVEELMA